MTALTKSRLTELLERVEAVGAIHDPDDQLAEERAISSLLHDMIVCGPDESKVVQPPIYTRSLDAAMQLAEHLIPAWFAFYLTQEWSGGATRKWSSVSAQNRVTISRNKDSYVDVEGTGYTLAAAFVAAMLRALADGEG
jgi:hypothetical protein